MPSQAWMGYGLIAEGRGADFVRVLEAGVQVVRVASADPQNITIRRIRPAIVKGRFVIAGTGRPDLDQAYVYASPTETDGYLLNRALNTSPKSDPGQFTVTTGGVGPHRLRVAMPDQDWVPEAIVLADGTDIVDVPYTFEEGKTYEEVRVILTDALSTIVGRVPLENLSGRNGGWTVTVFPEDELLWESPRLRAAGEVNGDGRFVVRNVVPGRAYLVARCPWRCGIDKRELSRRATRVYIDRPGSYDVGMLR